MDMEQQRPHPLMTSRTTEQPHPETTTTTTKALYDYQSTQDHTQANQSNHSPCLTYDEIFKKVSFALAESIASSTKPSTPDPHLRDYLATRRRASVSASATISAPNSFSNVHHHPRASSHSSNPNRPRVHFSAEPTSVYIPLHCTSSESDGRHPSTILPPQRSRSTPEPVLLPPPKPASEPRRLISFPRPFRRRLSIDRQAQSIALPPSPPPQAIELPPSPPPQAIELPPSPPPEFDFSAFESCVTRQGYNLLDNLPVKTDSEVKEVDMSRPLIDFDDNDPLPQTSPNFPPPPPLPRPSDFSPLPSPILYEPPPEWLFTSSPISDILNSPSLPYHSRFYKKKKQEEEAFERLEKESVVVSDEGRVLKGTLKDTKVELTNEGKDRIKKCDCKDEELSKNSSPKSTSPTGGYSLFGLKSPIQFSQIIPTVTSLWTSASSSNENHQSEAPIKDTSESGALSNARSPSVTPSRTRDEPAKGTIDCCAGTPASAASGTAPVFSPAIELLSPPTRPATPSNTRSPSVARSRARSPSLAPSRAPEKSAESTIECCPECCAQTPCSQVSGKGSDPSSAIDLLSPPTKASSRSRSPSVVPSRAPTPSVAPSRARTPSVAPSPPPAEPARPRSAASGSPEREGRPASVLSWTSYPTRPPSTQPDDFFSPSITTRASRLSDLVTTVRRRAVERAEELDLMLATAIAREREFDELLSQIRERERKRSEAFSTIVAKWAAQVPLPPDHSNTNSHAPTPTVHHTFAVFPSNPGSSASTAKASPARSSSPIRSPEPASSPAVAANRSPIPSPEPSARSPVAKSVNLNQETASADHQSPKESARSASADHQSPEESARSPTAVSARSVKAASVHSPTAVSVHSAGVASPVGLSIRSQSTTKPSIASVMSYIEEEARSVHSTKSVGEGKAESGNVTIRSPTAVSVHSASVASPVALSVRSQATLKSSAAYGMSKIEEDARSVRSIKSGDGVKSKSGSENGLASIRSPTAVSIHSAGVESPIALSVRSRATSRHSLACEKATIDDEARSVRSARSGGHDANGPESNGGGSRGGEEGKGTPVGEGPTVEPDQKKEECVEKPQEDLETGAAQATEIESASIGARAEAEKPNVAAEETREAEEVKESVPDEEKVEGDCTPVVAASVAISQAGSVLSEKASSVKSDHHDGLIAGDGGGGSILEGEGEENVIDFEAVVPSSTTTLSKCPTRRSIVPTSINKAGDWYRIGTAGFKFMTFDE